MDSCLDILWFLLCILDGYIQIKKLRAKELYNESEYKGISTHIQWKVMGIRKKLLHIPTRNYNLEIHSKWFEQHS